MVTSFTMRNRSILAFCSSVVLAAGYGALAPISVSAQSATPTPTPSPTPVTTLNPSGSSFPSPRTAIGQFTSGADHGRYVHTTNYDDTGNTIVQTVYTRQPDGAIRTETATTSHPDTAGGYTLSTSVIDFGASAEDTTQAAVTRVTPGQFTAVGTYTTAAGDGGKLRAVISNIDQGHATSELHVSQSNGGVTQILHLERSTGDSLEMKTLTLTPKGVFSAVTLARLSPERVITHSH